MAAKYALKIHATLISLSFALSKRHHPIPNQPFIHHEHFPPRTSQCRPWQTYARRESHRPRHLQPPFSSPRIRQHRTYFPILDITLHADNHIITQNCTSVINMTCTLLLSGTFVEHETPYIIPTKATNTTLLVQPQFLRPWPPLFLSAMRVR